MPPVASSTADIDAKVARRQFLACTTALPIRASHSWRARRYGVSSGPSGLHWVVMRMDLLRACGSSARPCGAAAAGDGAACPSSSRRATGRPPRARLPSRPRASRSRRPPRCRRRPRRRRELEPAERDRAPAAAPCGGDAAARKADIARSRAAGDRARGESRRDRRRDRLQRMVDARGGASRRAGCRPGSAPSSRET